MQELLLEDEAPRLLQAKRSEWPKATRPKADRSNILRIHAELKAMGVQMDKEDAEGVQKFPHASDFQRADMQVPIERAKQTGMDTQQLVVCLSRTISQRSRDDGLLPAGGLVVGSGLHYVASRQRPLLGLEELLLRGFPLSRLKYYNGMRDSDAVEIAALLNLMSHGLSPSRCRVRKRMRGQLVRLHRKRSHR